jgi:hypothetical protein
MTKLKRWLLIFVCLGTWAWLYGLFLRLEKTVEPKLFATGHQGQWWALVLLYWIADTAVLLCFARIAARPFGFRMPSGFPFFQFAADASVLLLLVHVAWLCTDHHLYPGLYSAGLASLPSVFIYLALAWGVVALMKYKQLVGILNRQASSPCSAH